MRRRLAAVRRRRRTETRLDAQGRPRAVAACGNCGGGPAENRGQHMRSQQERERVLARLAALPKAVEMLQERLADTLLKPLEEAIRVGDVGAGEERVAEGASGPPGGIFAVMV